jgi:hypothetical protein
MPTFTSYASDYEMHRGSIEMADLAVEQQNELIRLMFDQAAVVEQNVKHGQPDGLWTVIVAMGMWLERKSLVKDFTQRTEADRDRIIDTLTGSNLWLRLEEAFPPFDKYHEHKRYNWSEIETFSAKDAIAELDGDDAKVRLTEFLERPVQPADGTLFRMPYQTYKHEFDTGRLISFVDRGMAVQAYRLSDSNWAMVLPFTFLIGLVAFIPIMIFYRFWVGLAVLAIAIIAKRMLTKKAEQWVRQDALNSRERYRWYSARNIVWARRR